MLKKSFNYCRADSNVILGSFEPDSGVTSGILQAEDSVIRTQIILKINK